MFAMAAAVALLAASSTQAASVKEIFEKYNLVGIFAWDCTRPPTKDNLYFVNRMLDEGHVQLDEMSGPTARDWATIFDKAVELTQDEISISGDRNGVRSESVWRLQENRARGVESTLGDKKLIAGGKFINNGQATPWLSKCNVAGTQAPEPPAANTGPPEASGLANPPLGGPVITFVSNILAQPNQTITIRGSGFGKHDPYVGNSPFIRVSLSTGWKLARRATAAATS
jgi:hypothetical protein